MLTIVNYGLGNVLAFVNLCKRIGVETRVATTSAELEGAERIILPGVGAFDHAMELLSASGMRDQLEKLVLDHSVPVLGVCVGMQILAERSDEGSRSGLGWIRGQVRSLRAAQVPGGPRLPLPHMGWNDVRPVSDAGLFAGLENNARFYFLHSFYFECADAADIAAVSEYGIEFSCAVRRNNIFGVQFHPEKSHHFGMNLIKNFAGV